MTLRTVVTDTDKHTHTDGQASISEILQIWLKTTVLTTVTSLYVTGRYNTSRPTITVTTHFGLVFRRKITGSMSVRSCDNQRAPIIKRLISFDRELRAGSQVGHVAVPESKTSYGLLVNGRNRRRWNWYKMVEVRVFVVRDAQTALGDVYFWYTWCDEACLDSWHHFSRACWVIFRYAVQADLLTCQRVIKYLVDRSRRN